MGLVAKQAVKERVQRDLPKKGPRPARLTGLIDVGIHVREYQGEKKHPAREFIPIFTLMQDTYTTEEGELFNMISSPFFPIKLLEGAERGHYFDFVSALDPEDLFLIGGERNLVDLLGAKVSVLVKHTAPNKEGIVYANYAGIQPIAEDYPIKDFRGTFVVFDTENPDREVFDKLWETTKDQIRTSEGYAGSELERICEGSCVDAKSIEEIEADDLSDDIPF